MGDTPALRGQTEQALLDAIARDPRLEPAYYALGLFYHRRGNFALACTNLRKAVSLDSSDSQALYYLGDSLVKLGQTDEGRKLMAGSQALAAAKTEIDYLQKRTLVEPKDRQLRLRLARVYRKYENYEDALTQYQAYQRLGPADPKVQREFVDYIAQLKKQGVNPAAAAAPGMQ
jgi:Flp pilus assembly protein TadD